MAVTLTPVFEEQRLTVAGSISANLLIPPNPQSGISGDAATNGYYIAFSDGSLIMAYPDQTPGFQVMVEGAGSVRIDEVAGSCTVDWDIEWINVASNRAATALASRMPTRLPLLELMGSQA